MYSNNIIARNNVGVCWVAVANAGGVVDDHGGDYEVSCSRKGKKPRIPKRGPGVAELEKLLREEEKSVPSNSLPKNFTHLPDTPRPTRPTPPLTQLTPFPVNGNGDLKGCSRLGGRNVGGNGRSKGVYICEPGIFLPEKALLPVTWDSPDCRPKKGEAPPEIATDFSIPKLVPNRSDRGNILPPPMLQTNHGLCHPSMFGRNEFKEMNLFPGSSGIPSSSTPLSSSSAGLHRHGEPPSNQRICRNNTSTILAEEDKIIGAKRSRPESPDFPVYIWPPAPPPMPCQPPSFHPQISRLDPSSSSTNNAVGVLKLGKISRDLMPINPLELKKKTCVNDHGNPIGNGNALTTTPLPSTQNCQPDLSKFTKQSPFQEMKENTEKGSEEQRGATEEAVLGLETEKYCTEKSGDFIDLNLRLYTGDHGLFN